LLRKFEGIIVLVDPVSTAKEMCLEFIIVEQLDPDCKILSMLYVLKGHRLDADQPLRIDL
jgi:hypothetical protein